MHGRVSARCRDALLWNEKALDKEHKAFDVLADGASWDL
jgi:hypothetical protein